MISAMSKDLLVISASFKFPSRCKCGVKTNGTRSSDVICNELQGCTTSNIPTPSANYLTTPPTSNKMVSLIARLTSPHPHERAHTERIPTGTTTTMAAPGHTVTHIGTGKTTAFIFE